MIRTLKFFVEKTLDKVDFQIHKLKKNERLSLKFSETVIDKFDFLTKKGFTCRRRKLMAVRYESDKVFVEVHLTGIYLEISLEIGLLSTGKDNGFSIAYLIELEDSEKGGDYSTPTIGTYEHVRKCVSELASLLQQYGDRALGGDPEIFEKLQKLAETETDEKNPELKFAETVSEQFEFLTRKYGFVCIHQELRRVRYESDKVFVTLYYTRDCVVGLEIGLAGLEPETGFGTGWLVLLEDPEREESTWDSFFVSSFSNTSQSVRRRLSGFASVLQQYGSGALKGDPEVFQRLQNLVAEHLSEVDMKRARIRDVNPIGKYHYAVYTPMRKEEVKLGLRDFWN